MRSLPPRSGLMNLAVGFNPCHYPELSFACALFRRVAA
jgi:hypothetical protein